MKKITKIEILKMCVIRCTFNNDEIRDFDIKTILDPKGKYSSKIYQEDVFSKVKLSPFGYIYWDGIAEMKSLNGESIACEYDICPDFVYMKSVRST